MAKWCVTARHSATAVARPRPVGPSMSPPPPPPPPTPGDPGTALRTVSIVEQVVASVGPWSRIALAERSLRRGLELATPDGHPLDAVTVASIHSVLDRARAARLAGPGEPSPMRAPGTLLSIRTAQKPAESALVGAALALLQALDAAPRARSERAFDIACATGAQRCIERTLPLLIPKLIEAWTALRTDARHLAAVDPSHAPLPPPLSDTVLGALWAR